MRRVVTVICLGIGLAALLGNFPTPLTARPSEEKASLPSELAHASTNPTVSAKPGSSTDPGSSTNPGAEATPSPRATPPVLKTLDQNSDGEISQDEMQDAPAALRRLDANGNGELTRDELQSPRAALGERDPHGQREFGGNVAREWVLPDKVSQRDGAAKIPTHAAFQELSYKGDEVLIDTFLAGLEFVKFTIAQVDSEEPRLYFINTRTHRGHRMFARAVGLPQRGGEQMKGVLVFRPRLKSPSGKAGLYTFEFEPMDSYRLALVERAQQLLIEKMPILEGNLAYYPRQRGIATYEEEKALYEDSDVVVYLEEDLRTAETGYLPLNPGAACGRLCVVDETTRPGPRDVAIFQFLPNDLPRVAGILTTVRQTPLSHVNLRAIQDQAPNAFLHDALSDPKIRGLLGRNVFYQVTDAGYVLREATPQEVASHFDSMRPKRPQTPRRDLTATTIEPLQELRFDHSARVGVKAANLAEMGRFGFPDGSVPRGYAVPFYFYDEFMKHNGFYDYAEELLTNPRFKSDRDVQENQLRRFRSLIKHGKMPPWMEDALEQVHRRFPTDTSLRCRSSTNNEDLPGFSGAGLYDSFTHHPSEGPLSKSIKQVFASLWNFRAVEEREFFQVDHLAAAMGVLIHPSYKGELANGVAVTSDILYENEGVYYLNVQVGDDMVTNPGEASSPEEGLLDWWDSSDYRLLQSSSRVSKGRRLLASTHLAQIADRLAMIHARFARLYGKSLTDEKFAMEIEFKISRDGRLVVKQARPWVYAPGAADGTPDTRVEQ